MAGKLVKWLLIESLLLLPWTALAAAQLPPADSPAAQCLEALGPWGYKNAALCTDETGHWLMSFSGEDAFAAVRTDDTVALCRFYQEDDAWEVAWVNDYHPFGVDANGVDLQPEYLRFSGDALTWFVADDTETVEVTATYDGWEWYVTGLKRHALVDGKWQAAGEVRDEVLSVLEGFSLYQENEPEPAYIEGNKLIAYPEMCMDAHYTVPNGVEIIGEYAFSGNQWLVHVTLPESVRVIEEGAFADCYNLHRVDMPSALESLGAVAFAQTHVNCTIPEGLMELPDAVFCSADMQGTVVIPEGVTNIGWECFAFEADITDIYLPASLQTIGGETFQQGATFWYIWDFNSVDAGETHMTVHAPAGTEAARFARWSGESYVIEDAREGTDLPAVTAWVQSVLDEVVPGAKVCKNQYDFPCVTYSADTVFAFAMRDRTTRYGPDEYFLCCFDRVGNELTLLWVNDGLYGTEYWNRSEYPVPLEMALIGDELHLMLRLGEETAVWLNFTGKDFCLSEMDVCYWYKYTDGPPPYWDTALQLPVTDGMPLREYTVWPQTSREYVVQGTVFDEEAVLLFLYDMIGAAGLDYTFENNSKGIAHFDVGDTTYVLDEKNMTLTREDDEEQFNLILPAPGSTDFRSEIIDGRWMVDAHTVEVTFDRILGWPIRINIDRDTQTVTVCAE